MIVLPWFFLLLVSLPAFTSQQAPIYSSRKSVIDWTTCGSEARCICVNDPSKPLEMKKQEPVPAPTKTSLESEEGLCNIGVHQKYLDDNFALFQLQVIGVQTELKTNPQLILYRKTPPPGPASNNPPPILKEPLFGCKYNSKTEKVEVDGDPDIIKTYNIELFPSRSRFESDNVICAVTVKSATKLAKEMGPPHGKYKSMNTMMHFLNADYEHDESEVENKLYTSLGTRCDPYLFNDPVESQKYHILPIINRDKNILNCGEGDSPSYTMRYDKDGEPPGTEMMQLECVKDEIDGYHYKLVKESDEIDPQTQKRKSEDVMIPESYTFYCAANIDETCKNPYKCDHNADPTCPEFMPGRKGHAAKLTCPGNKWLIKGEYLELTVQPNCQRDKNSNEKDPVFHFTLPIGKKEVIPDARCFTTYNCKMKSKLILPVCNDETTCGAVDDSNGILKCKDENKQMTVIAQGAGSVASNLSSYACNPSTGSYFNETTIISARSRVRCMGEQKAPPVAKAKYSDSQITGMIIGACVITGLILVAILLAIHFYCKRSKVVQKRQKKKWVKMKRANRIARCRDDFEKILEATVDTATHILEGLDWMELLLDTETEEPECWEEVYEFVERLQGAIEHLDLGIWQMFNRYLYLQAKKIIDKHTWLAPERITKNNPKGLIRAVAIRLLSFTMNDPKNEDTEDFVAAGYSQLGFKAVEQYPHCGLMWSLIMHTRAVKNEDKPVRLNNLKFLETLMKIAGKGMMVVPKEDVIPVLGSVEEQAAYAIGGAPVFAFNIANSNKILLELNTSDKGAVTKSYFKGMGDSLWRFSMQTVLTYFDMWPNPNPTLLEKVRKTTPEAQWNDLAVAAVKVMLYYGLNVDAKRMYLRFLPKKNGFEALQLEQKNFGEAVEKVKEDLRAWFAKRTDKEELKKKPEYNMDANVKLDDRVGTSASNVEQKSEDNKPGTPGSGGSTNSDQTPKQTTSEPKDAAAPAAAPAAEAPAKPAP